MSHTPENLETDRLKELQSWVYQQRVALQTTDPDYFAKYDVWKAVGVQIRSALSKSKDETR
jgi:hypothetical protein